MCLEHPWLYLEINSDIFVSEPNNNSRDNSLNIKSISLEGIHIFYLLRTCVSLKLIFCLLFHVSVIPPEVNGNNIIQESPSLLNVDHRGPNNDEIDSGIGSEDDHRYFFKHNVASYLHAF